MHHRFHVGSRSHRNGSRNDSGCSGGCGIKARGACRGHRLRSYRLLTLYMRLFTDAAHNVRMACAGSVADVLRVMGRDWGEKDFLPFLQCLFKEQHSSVKVTLLYAIQNVMEMDHLEEDLLPEKRMVIDALSVGNAYRITNRTWFPMSDLSPAESSRRHTHDFPKVSKQITSLHSILPRLDSSKTPSHGS